MADLEIIIGVAETGKYIAASTSSPYFCFEADTEEAVKDKAAAALKFYRAASEHEKQQPHRSRTEHKQVTKLLPKERVRPEMLECA